MTYSKQYLQNKNTKEYGTLAPKHSISQSAIINSTQILAEIWKLLSFLIIRHPILQSDGRGYQDVNRRMIYRKVQQNEMDRKRSMQNDWLSLNGRIFLGRIGTKHKILRIHKRNSGWILEIMEFSYYQALFQKQQAYNTGRFGNYISPVRRNGSYAYGVSNDLS